MRKEIDIRITDEGRDKDKVFHIREMPSSQAEKWAMRALLAVARSGVDLPEGFAQGGMRNLAVVGMQALMRISFEDAEPLLDEMMGCISIKPDPRNPDVIRSLMDDVDIEEVATRFRLRQEVLTLHTGFSFGAKSSESTSPAPGPTSSSPSTETSPPASVQFSRSPPTRRPR